MVRHTYFQQSNEDYQHLTRYSLIEDLGLIKLSQKEIENLPDCLTALPNLQFNELKRRLVEIKKPFNIHLNISFILVVVGGLILCPIIAYVLWQIYKVHSRVKGFKPMANLFNEQKGEIFNISDIVSNRLHILEGWLSSLMSTINTATRAELALPSTSGKPTPPPRRELHIHTGTEYHSTNNTRDCKRHGQTTIQDRRIQEISAETSSRRPKVISQENF